MCVPLRSRVHIVTEVETGHIIKKDSPQLRDHHSPSISFSLYCDLCPVCCWSSDKRVPRCLCSECRTSDYHRTTTIDNHPPHVRSALPRRPYISHIHRPSWPRDSNELPLWCVCVCVWCTGLGSHATQQYNTHFTASLPLYGVVVLELSSHADTLRYAGTCAWRVREWWWCCWVVRLKYVFCVFCRVTEWKHERRRCALWWWGVGWVPDMAKCATAH